MIEIVNRMVFIQYSKMLSSSAGSCLFIVIFIACAFSFAGALFDGTSHLAFPGNINKLNVTVIGGGSWGTAIAKRLALNIACETSKPIITMWLRDEFIGDNNDSLVDIINQKHENVKYLPDIKLPHNIIASSDIESACEHADVLVFAVPHQYISSVVDSIVDQDSQDDLSDDSILELSDKKPVVALSLCKGVVMDSSSGPKLISEHIASKLSRGLRWGRRTGRYVTHSGVLMGANVAADVANENFCEATIAVRSLDHDKSSGAKVSDIIQRLFNSQSSFRVNVADPAAICDVEIFGALKNIVSMGAGFCDGLQLGSSSKAAVMRQGIEEMRRFCDIYRQVHDLSDRRDESSAHGWRELDVIFQSCGIGDVIASSIGGRNRKCAEAFVREILYNPKYKHLSEPPLLAAEEEDSNYGEGSESGVDIAASASSREASALGLWAKLENNILLGQKLQGLMTSRECMDCLAFFETKVGAKFPRMLERFPLFRKVYRIAYGLDTPESLFDW